MLCLTLLETAEETSSDRINLSNPLPNSIVWHCMALWQHSHWTKETTRLAVAEAAHTWRSHAAVRCSSACAAGRPQLFQKRQRSQWHQRHQAWCVLLISGHQCLRDRFDQFPSWLWSLKPSLYRNQEEAARTPKPCAVGVLGARPEACARVKIHIVSCQADHGWTVRKNSSEAVAWACFIAKRGPWLSRWDSCQDGGHQGGQGESLKVGSWMSWKISILRDCLSERSGMSKSMCIFQFLFVSLLFIFHLPVVVPRWYAQNSEANGKYWNIKRRQLEVGRTDIQHLGISKHCIDFVIFELCLWRKTGVSEDLWVYWYILTEDEIWKVRQSFYWTSHKGSYVNSTRVLAAVVVALSFYLPGNSSHEPSTQSESCQSWQWMMQTYLNWAVMEIIYLSQWLVADHASHFVSP